jgi:hypothetical protein
MESFKIIKSQCNKPKLSHNGFLYNLRRTKNENQIGDAKKEDVLAQLLQIMNQYPF